MRVAIIFFGIARGLKISIASIEKNIYECNRADGVSFYTIASLNLVETVSNPRTDENDVPLRYEDAFLLNADSYLLVRQEDAAIATQLAAVQSQPDIFNNGWISIRNTLHQLASLQRGWAFLEANLPKKFDYFLFLRPDLIYLDEMRLKNIVAGFSGEGNMALPPWHSFWGFNDRFALADRHAARQYATRLNLVGQYCNLTSMHPERFLAYALQAGGCKVCSLPNHARRVRAHGAVREEDFSQAVNNLPAKPKLFSIQVDAVCFLSKDADGMDLTQNDSTPDMAMAGKPSLAAPIVLTSVFVDGFKRVQPLNGVPYLAFLQGLHDARSTARYLEIGTQTGKSLELACGPALAIDPAFVLDKDAWSAKPGINLFEMTSDDFFQKHDPREILGGPIGLAFIDGMHLSEFVFRDFLNVEKFCSPDAIIVLHDCIPINFEMTERHRNPAARHDKPLATSWTGDVWRVVPILQSERPDLKIQIFDCPPTGLVLISHLDPSYRMPPERLEEVQHIFTDHEPSEDIFWQFIESLAVVDSYNFTNRPRTTKPRNQPTALQWLRKVKNALRFQ